MTKALWTNGNLEAWNGPADKANLRLYANTNRNDLLVIYDEYSERSDTTRTRAYWLNKNEGRLEERQRPNFANANSALHLTSVPVFETLPQGTNSSVDFLALFASDQQRFTLYSHQREISSHWLPQYNDGRGKVEKAALTPLAVTADLTIVGGFLGCAYLGGIASGYNASY